MIDITTYEEDSLPISIIVPLSKSRRYFFDNMVFPLLEANRPAEIIVDDSNNTAPIKRTNGYKESTQPYIFFCDDDILLPANHLKNLYDKLIKSTASYAYSGYKGIVLNPQTHPMRGNFQIPTLDFDPKRLTQHNYISTMSLIKREDFPGFDLKLKRFQDWDLWLTMLENEKHGVAVHNNEFYAYYLDEGITSVGNNERDAAIEIIRKHNLGV